MSSHTGEDALTHASLIWCDQASVKGEEVQGKQAEGGALPLAAPPLLLLKRKKEDAMTTGNETHAGGGTTRQRVEAAPAAPLVVIVEEQPAVQELLRWMLLLAGYRTRVYAEREAVLTWGEQALKPGDDPAVLLLDLSLRSAAEAADYVRRVRAHWQESCDLLPAIIILTTQPPVQTALGTRERVLLKPFHVHDLLALIQQAAPVGSAEQKRGCPGEREADAADQ